MTRASLTELWWIDSFADGFGSQPAHAISLFRVLVAVAILWKIAWEHHWGAWNYFNTDNYVRWRWEHTNRRYDIIRRRQLPVGTTVYRTLYVIRVVAATCFLLGVGAQPAALVLAAWFFFQASFERWWHPVYLGCVTLLLALSPGIDDHFTLMSSFHVGDVAGPGVDPWPQLMLMLLVVQMYWSSAYLKARSPQFRSGAVLYEMFNHMSQIRRFMPHYEIGYPRVLQRSLIDGDREVISRRWRPAALMTIGAEFAIPPLLLLPSTYFVAAAVGVVMHAGFTAIWPIRLLPFTIGTVSSYLLFIDPQQVARVIG